MESIKDMINRLCPNGVKRIKLADCLEYEQPTKYQVSSKDYLDNGTPVLTAGQTFILGYTDETNGVYHASKEQPVIIFDDFTTSFHWVDFDFKVKSSAMKMLTPCNKEANFRFIYYAMKCIKYETLEHSRQWISTYSQFEIPLPPLEIQSRIVEVLDKMTTLTAELEAELEARKQQYEYYRRKLLTFSEIGGGGNRQVAWKKISEICVLKAGKTIKASELSDIKDSEHQYPCYGGNGIRGYIAKYSHEGRYAIIGRQGALCGCVNWVEGKFYATEHAVVCTPKTLSDTRFLYFLFTNENLNRYKSQGAQPGLSVANLNNIMLPIPPLSEQQRIVSILDRFEALTADLQSGLPAEIEARRQQYEYYRNKLLTFDAV